MFTLFLVLITIVCFLLVVVIMVQNPKGGGLSSSVGGSTQMGGVQKTTDFLDKSTWYLAVILVALIMLSSLSYNGTTEGQSKIMSSEEATSAPAPVKPATPVAPATPVTPAPAPAK